MAGARNTEGAALDTTIGTLLTQFASYDALEQTGEPKNAPANYFLRSLFSRLQTDTALRHAMEQSGYAFPHFKPVSLSEAASPTLVLIDPHSSA